MKVFITPAELAAHQKEYIVIDGRGAIEAGRGHIEGAYVLGLEDLTAPVQDHGGRHPLPNLDAFASKLGKFGIDGTKPVVIYDDWMSTVGRLWWMLRYIGLDTVYVLSGGVRRWVAEGYELVTTVTPVCAACTLAVKLRPDFYLTHEDVLAITKDRSKVLIDVRAPERYRGETEPLDPVAGHVPTAINLYYELPYTADGLKDKTVLDGLFQPIADDGRPVVVYCGSGITAPIELLAMYEWGLTPALYLGSFSDWISYPNAQIATGTELITDR